MLWGHVEHIGCVDLLANYISHPFFRAPFLKEIPFCPSRPLTKKPPPQVRFPLLKKRVVLRSQKEGGFWGRKVPEGWGGVDKEKKEKRMREKKWNISFELGSYILRDTRNPDN